MNILNSMILVVSYNSWKIIVNSFKVVDVLKVK